MSYSLIAGLHSFMEEDIEESSSVDISPEEIDAIERAAEAGSEIVATDTEIESVSDQTEMFMERFDEIINRYNYVKRYGVDRTFMRLFNSENELSRQFNYYFPSCESFGMTGDPKSKESIVCMEGFVDIVKDIWNFIKGVIKKVFGFFGKIFESVRVRMGELNGQIGRLRKLNAERTSDVAKIENVDKQIWSLNNLTSNGSSSDDNETKEEKKSGNEDFAVMAADAAPASANKQSDNNNNKSTAGTTNNRGGLEGAFVEINNLFDADKALKQLQSSLITIQQYCESATQVTTKDAPDGVNDVHLKPMDTEMENIGEKIKEFRKSWKDTKSEMKKAVGRVDKTEIKYVPGTAIDGYLNFAAKLMSILDKNKANINQGKAMCTNVSTIVNHMDARGDTGKNGFSLAAHKKIANGLSTVMNLSTEINATMANLTQKLASMAVYAASARLSYRTKSDGD